MDLSRACEILGVTPDADRDTVQEAYERRFDEIRIQRLAHYTVDNDSSFGERDLEKAFQFFIRSFENLPSETIATTSVTPASAPPRLPTPTFPAMGDEATLSGPDLKELRETAGFSLEYIEQATKISRRYLLALEAGDSTKLPAAAYIKGFVIAYANALGMPCNEAARAYLRYMSEGGCRPTDSSSS